MVDFIWWETDPKVTVVQEWAAVDRIPLAIGMMFQFPTAIWWLILNLSRLRNFKPLSKQRKEKGSKENGRILKNKFNKFKVVICSRSDGWELKDEKLRKLRRTVKKFKARKSYGLSNDVSSPSKDIQSSNRVIVKDVEGVIDARLEFLWEWGWIHEKDS